MNQRQKKQIIMNQRKSASKKIPNTKTQIPNSKFQKQKPLVS